MRRSEIKGQDFIALSGLAFAWLKRLAASCSLGPGFGNVHIHSAILFVHSSVETENPAPSFAE